MLKDQYSYLPDSLLSRLFNSYGTEALKILEGVNSMNDLGQHFGHSLYKKEVDYLIDEEWAKTAEDILFRRTKLGLEMKASLALSQYIQNR